MVVGKQTGHDRRNGDAETKEVRDVAMRGLHLIESHMKECATLQVRIEKQQDEIKANQKEIAAEVTEINVRAATMQTIQQASSKTQGEMAVKFDGFSDRLNKVELRLAVILALLLGAEKAIEHWLR